MGEHVSKKTGLLESTRRGYFRISDRGLKVLEKPPKEINVNYLEQYQEFIDFRGSSKPGESELGEDLTYEDTTPEELIGIGHQKLQADLASKLMIEHDVGVSTIASYTIKKMDSDYFMEA